VHGAVLARPPLGVVLGSLAVGGAERIVLDWAERNRARHEIRLCVLSRQVIKWPVPTGIAFTQLEASDWAQGLTAFASSLHSAWLAGGYGAPRVVCHMTLRAHRDVLKAAGVVPVPVLHNARDGWRERASEVSDAQRVVVISEACREELRAAGVCAPASVIRHLPPRSDPVPDARARLCATLALPGEATLIAMVGGVKPQKNYCMAVRLLRTLVQRCDAYLVIFGGPIGADGAACWRDLLAGVVELGLQSRVRLPGFVPDVATFLSAFDLLLNTSHFEGLSMATLEALVAGVPVVASAVGGQGEVPAESLVLVPPTASSMHWLGAIDAALQRRPTRPVWAGFPAHRLWSLEHLASDTRPQSPSYVLFVTANLNAGGAQRSLVNLTKRLGTKLRLEVVVTGLSTTSAFVVQLQRAGVAVHRTGDTRDAFDHAEALLAIASQSQASVVCFWNVDAKIKLLLAKALPASVDLVDVSPGGYAFEEMLATATFQQLCGFTQAEYYARLAQLVLKYDAALPAGVSTPSRVIRNGVPRPRRWPRPAPVPRVIVNGRMAPSKFLVEIVQAHQLMCLAYPSLELHA
jgi:glycosyltransferase involved in cell wall biosynthesis